MVQLTDAPVIILEGDEYLSSPIDRRPKFHLYKPHIALISGIAWDHINVFPTFENYIEQFDIFINQIEPNGYLTYCENDIVLKKLVTKNTSKIKKEGYSTPANYIEKGITFLKTEIGNIPLMVFGDHNLQNINGAKLICNQLGVDDADFFRAIATFKGAAKRLELIAKSETTAVYKDFAHSPSKLKATTKAVKQQYPDRKVVACMELHTFSSLNKKFLSEYENAMSDADEAYVYYSEHTLAHKKLEHITPAEVKNAFASDNVEVINDSKQLVNVLENKNWNNSVLLLMSSGNFDGVDLNAFGEKIVG